MDCLELRTCTSDLPFFRQLWKPKTGGLKTRLKTLIDSLLDADGILRLPTEVLLSEYD